jgi:hypothetical protein
VLFTDGDKLPPGYEFAYDGMLFDITETKAPAGGSNA